MNITKDDSTLGTIDLYKKHLVATIIVFYRGEFYVGGGVVEWAIYLLGMFNRYYYLRNMRFILRGA